jgi:hypothetical protein
MGERDKGKKRRTGRGLEKYKKVEKEKKGLINHEKITIKNEEKAGNLKDGNRTGIKKNRKRKGKLERKGNEDEERSKLLRNRKSAMKDQNTV